LNEHNNSINLLIDQINNFNIEIKTLSEEYSITKNDESDSTTKIYTVPTEDLDKSLKQVQTNLFEKKKELDAINLNVAHAENNLASSEKEKESLEILIIAVNSSLETKTHALTATTFELENDSENLNILKAQLTQQQDLESKRKNELVDLNKQLDALNTQYIGLQKQYDEQLVAKNKVLGDLQKLQSE